MTFNLFAMGFRAGQKVSYEDVAKMLATLEGDCVTDGELDMLKAGIALIRARAKELLK
jgi:hypothetical protein